MAERHRDVRLVQAVRAGLMAALVTVVTFLVQIPNPATRGYINLGDIMIFVSALTFGPLVGGTAGSVGSALSDIISGYGYYAPFTFANNTLLAVTCKDALLHARRDFPPTSLNILNYIVLHGIILHNV